MLEKHDQNGYRIIWCCYKYEASIDNKLYHERIRIHEEIDFSRQVTQDSDTKLMYLKFRKTVCNMQFTYDENSREEIGLKKCIKRMFKKRALYNHKHKQFASIAYDFIKSIVGDKKHEKVLLCVMNIIMQSIVDMRDSIYKIIADVTKKKTKNTKEKQFIALFQKPYTGNERGYQLFLRK